METLHWITVETSLYSNIYQEKQPCISSSIGVICVISHPTGSRQFSCSPWPLLLLLSSFWLLYLPLSFSSRLFGVVSLSLSLYTCFTPIFSPPTQMSHSWRTSPSRTWATPPSVSAGHRSTPQPSPVTGSRWWQRARAYPSLRTLFCPRLVSTLSTDWSLVSTTTSVWSLWRRTARASPPSSLSRPVRSLFPSNQKDFLYYFLYY